MIACIYCGGLEAWLLVPLLGFVVAIWRKIKHRCNCKCHDEHDGFSENGSEK